MYPKCMGMLKSTHLIGHTVTKNCSESLSNFEHLHMPFRCRGDFVHLLFKKLLRLLSDLRNEQKDWKKKYTYVFGCILLPLEVSHFTKLPRSCTFSPHMRAFVMFFFEVCDGPMHRTIRWRNYLMLWPM